jgi:hypothetical protein
MAIDFSKYAARANPGETYDYGAGMRALAVQRLNEARLAEDQRQANMSEAGVQKRHSDSMSYNREALDSTNDRYAVGLADEERSQRYKAKIAKKKQFDDALSAFNKSVVSTDFNSADAMLGTLKTMGAQVDRQVDEKGMPKYRVEPPSFDEGFDELDASNIRSQIGNNTAQQSSDSRMAPNSGNPQQNEQSNLFTEKNPFDSMPGASAAMAQPEPIPSDGSFVAPPQPEANAIFTPPGQSPETAQQEQPQQPGLKNPFDPYELNTSQMLEQNQRRLKPFTEGMINAVPGRFQGRMGDFYKGVSELGLPLERTLELTQKPLDTQAGLMKSELGAENARARINVSMGGQEANRNIRLEDRMWRRMDGIGKSFDLTGRKLKLDKVNETIGHLNKNNPSADGLMISTIRNMFEAGVMTDRDYQNTKSGIKTVLQQIKDGVDEKLIGTGLNPDSRAGLTQFLRDITRDDTAAVQKAQAQLLTQAQRAGSEEELKTVYDYISANVPQALWSDEVKQEFGIPVERKTGSMDKEGNYATNKSPKTGAPKQSASIDVNSEVESLLDGD